MVTGHAFSLHRFQTMRLSVGVNGAFTHMSCSVAVNDIQMFEVTGQSLMKTVLNSSADRRFHNWLATAKIVLFRAVMSECDITAAELAAPHHELPVDLLGWFADFTMEKNTGIRRMPCTSSCSG